MDSEKREMDDFDRALKAEAQLSEDEIKRLSEQGDEDFRKVSHDECIYRSAVDFLDTAVNSPRNILAAITGDESITEVEKRYLELFKKAIIKESATLSKLAKSALAVARKLEEEHLARIERVSRTLSKEDSASATLCYPVTTWNLEKYCWRLLYHMGIYDIADLSKVASHLSGEYVWVKQAYKRVNLIPLVMLDYNWNYAWDVALSNIFSEPFPSSNQERGELHQKYRQRKRSYAGALAEVHFGNYQRFRGLPRHEVGDIADKLENAGYESMLNEIDYYSKKLKETAFFEQLPVDVPYLIKGLGDKCKKNYHGTATVSLGRLQAAGVYNPGDWL